MWSLIILSLPIVVISFLVERKWYRPVVLFNGVWLIIFILFQLQLFRTIEIDDRTIGILLVQTIAFPMGSLLAYFVSKKYQFVWSVKRAGKSENPGHELRAWVFWSLCAITVLILIRDELRIIRMLLSGSSFLEIMRMSGGKMTVEISGAVNVFLYMFIVHPMTGCISPVCAVEFFSQNKKKYYYLAVNLVIVALAALHHGGRNSVFQFAICYLLCFFMMGKKIHFSRRVKRILWGVLVAVVVAVFFLSASRGIEELGLSLYAYLIAPIPLCTIYLSTPSAAVRTWGFTALKGFFYPLFSVLSVFGIKQPEAYRLSVLFRQYTEDNYVRIGDYSATGINSFLPAGAFFYVDGGYLFEFFAMLLYGFVVYCLYHVNKKRNDKRTRAFVIMFSVGLLLSFISFQLSTYHYAIGMILMWAVLYRITSSPLETQLSSQE